MAVKDTPFWAFNCAYLLFLSPVLYCLFMAHLGGDPEAWKAPLLPPAADAWPALAAAAGLSLWLAALGAGLRQALTALGWKLGAKTAAQQKDDFVRMAYANISLSVLARVQGRFEVSFLLLVAFYTAFFAILFEMARHTNLEIAFDLARNLRGLWIFAVGVAVLLGVLHAHVRLAFAQGLSFGLSYLGWVALALLGHAAAVALPPAALDKRDESGPARLHVHHWHWAFFATHFAVFDSALSRVSQALFLGVYLHGAACFGLEAIFEAKPVSGAARD